MTTNQQPFGTFRFIEQSEKANVNAAEQFPVHLPEPSMEFIANPVLQSKIFSLDKKYIACIVDKNVFIAETFTGRVIYTYYKLDTEQLEEIILSPTGNYLGLIGKTNKNRVMRIIEVTSGNEIYHFSYKIKRYHEHRDSLVWSHDEKYIALGLYYDGIKIIDMRTFQEVLRYRYSYVRVLAWSQNSKYIVIEHNHNVHYIQVIEHLTGKKMLRRYISFLRYMHFVSLNDEGFLVREDFENYSLTNIYTKKEINFHTRKASVSPNMQTIVYCAPFVYETREIYAGPDGWNWIETEEDTYDVVKVVHIPTKKEVMCYHATKENPCITSLSLSPNGQYILFEHQGYIKIIGAFTGNEIIYCKPENTVYAASWLSDGIHILVERDSKTFSIWDVSRLLALYEQQIDELHHRPLIIDKKKSSLWNSLFNWFSK